MWDANQPRSDMPAWDPSSQTPIPVPKSPPSLAHGSTQVPTSAKEETLPPPGNPSQYSIVPFADIPLPADWLAMECFHGKSIKVCLMETRQIQVDGCKRIKFISMRTMAYTMGTPVSGDPPMIEVKPMIPGASSMSTPLRCLVLVTPRSVNERAFIIAGELRGTEVIVVKAGALGHLWSWHYLISLPMFSSCHLPII